MFRADRGRKHLNDQERAAIIAFTEAGKTVADISERLGIGAATVSLWQNRFRETGSIIRKQGSGRPKKLTPENEKDKEIIARCNCSQCWPPDHHARIKKNEEFIRGEQRENYFHLMHMRICDSNLLSHLST